MLRLRTTGLITLVLLRCGGSSISDDGGVDSGPDASLADAGHDATTTDSSTKDVVTTDVVNDVSLDSPADAPGDAPLDAPVGDGGWTVSSISGLVLWLDAAKGVTTTSGSISAWADQSGQGNNAAAGTATPTLVSSSINSLPAAHFVASSQQYLIVTDATSLQWGMGDYTLAVVAKFDNAADAGIAGLGSLYTKLGPMSGLLFFGNDIDYAASFEAGAPVIFPGLSNVESVTTEVQYHSGYNDGTPRLYAVQRASGTETLRVNGSQVASGTSSIDVSESGVDVNIGALLQMGNAAAVLDGDIAEMVAVKGTLSSSDLSSLESYLQSKYAL